MTPVFQHMGTLLSFVLAFSVSHQLFAVVEIVRAKDRVKQSVVHSLWMANCFLAVVSWWIGFWDLREITQWPVIVVLALLAGVIALFLAVAFVSPRIPPAGSLDLWQFHLDNRRKYLTPLLSALFIAVVVSLYYGNVQSLPNQNIQAIIFACMILAGLVAFFSPNAMAQRIAAVAYFAGAVLYFAVGDPMLVSN